MKAETKTQAETTQSGMSVELNKVIEIIKEEIWELENVRFRSQKSETWKSENFAKIKTLKKLRSKVLLLGRPIEVKE